ncbi:unnamed protein product [Ectocarpus sp. 4 AP-2014]
MSKTVTVRSTHFSHHNTRTRHPSENRARKYGHHDCTLHACVGACEPKAHLSRMMLEIFDDRELIPPHAKPHTTLPQQPNVFTTTITNKSPRLGTRQTHNNKQNTLVIKGQPTIHTTLMIKTSDEFIK